MNKTLKVITQIVSPFMFHPSDYTDTVCFKWEDTWVSSCISASTLIDCIHGLDFSVNSSAFLSDAGRLLSAQGANSHHYKGLN